VKKSTQLQQKYRRLYKDIIAGYCSVSYDERPYYAKHFKEVDFGNLEQEGEIQKQEAISKGLLAEKEKIEMLTEAGHWDDKDEAKYNSLIKEISNLELTANKIFVASQRKGIEKDLEEKRKEFQPLFDDRIKLVEPTAESFAEKKKNEIFVRLSLFEDKEFQKPAFSQDDYDEMTPSELAEIIFAFNKSMSDFDSKLTSRIAAMPFFMNSFFLCKDNPQVYFGKPIIELTTYQVELFSKATFYKSVLSSGKSPPELYYDDLDKLVGWYDMQSDSGGSASSDANNSSSGRRTSSKSQSQATGIVGANKAEAEAFASKQGGDVINLAEAAKKMKKDKGKDKLDIYDMAELHGLLDGS
jgi:hypothetical protein